MGTAVAVLPLFAAFEAHVINVTARIENALKVPVDPLKFGTVFPQEYLIKHLPVQLSDSFMREDRVDDVEYFIRQKPKCAWSWVDQTGNWQIDYSSTQTGHVIVGDNPNTPGVLEEWWVDCGKPEQPSTEVPPTATWGVLPNLCPYLSKDEDTEDGSEMDNDGSLPAFHHPFSIVNGQIVWNEVDGRLSKIAGDIADDWIIDLAVPCFGGYCAQDWEKFVKDKNKDAIASEWTQPIANEHKVFGCDLWLEVKRVSEKPI